MAHMVRTAFALMLAGTMAASAQQQAPPKDSAVIGSVIDATTGAPIAGAIVTLTPTVFQGIPDSETERALTNTDGQFAFSPLAARAYNVRASMGGFLSSAYGRVRIDGAAQSITVAPRQIVDNIEIKMWKGATIGGTITDEFGEPVVGCVVTVARRTWTNGRALWEVAATPYTDDRGVYRLSNQMPGEYTALVSAMRVSYPEGFTPTAQFSAALLDLQKYSTPLLPPNAAGQPMVQMNATLTGPSGSVQNEGLGRFLTQTAQATRSIAPALSAAGPMRVYPTTFAPGVMSATSARVVTVDAGQTIANLDVQIQLVRGFSIKGTITSPSGPAAYSMVRLQPADLGPEIGENGFDTAIGVTDARGAFALDGVPAGAYVLRASQANPRFMGLPGTVDMPISVDRDITDLAVTMTPAVRLTGRVVVDDKDSKAPRVTVILRDNYPVRLPPQAYTNEDGSFSIVADPGTYTVSLIGARDWYVKSALIGGRDIATTPTELSVNPPELVVTITQKMPGMTGTVRDSAGLAAPDAMVLIFPTDRRQWGQMGLATRTFQEVRVDPTGVFTAEGLAPGEYFAVAITDAELTKPRTPEFLESAARSADRVTVVEGEMTSHDLKRTVIR